MASRSASRTVVFHLVPSGQSGLAGEARRGGGAGGLLRLGAGTGRGLTGGGRGSRGADVGHAFALFNSMAMGVFTFTPFGAFGHRILPIDAFIHGFEFHRGLVGLDLGEDVPAETVSPSFTSHLASVPSSIVGERAGMRISVAMSVKLPLRRSGARIGA
jgi:hypothetical protein